MILIALNIAFVAVAVSQLLAMLRLLKGPNTGDRILSLDTMVVNAIALIILLFSNVLESLVGTPDPMTPSTSSLAKFRGLCCPTILFGDGLA